MGKTYTIKLNLTENEMFLLMDAMRELWKEREARLQEELEGGKNDDGTITIPAEPYEKFMKAEILMQKISGEINAGLIFGENK